jgi:hypothetical protein
MKQPHFQAANKAVLARDESNVYVCVRLADPTVETGEHMRAQGACDSHDRHIVYS